MNDLRQDSVTERFSESESDQEKTAIASQLAKNADASLVDNSRSTLHNGERASGENWERSSTPEYTGDRSSRDLGAGGAVEEKTIDPSTPPADPVEVAGSRGAKSHAAPSNSEGGPDRFEAINATGQLGGTASLRPEPEANSEREMSPTGSSSPNGKQKTFENEHEHEHEHVQANTAPSQVFLSDNTVSENADGAIIGKLNAMDGDAGDAHSFTVSDGRFAVEDGNLVLRPGVTLNHEEASSLTVEVTATDSSGASVTQKLEVEVLDLNEGPTEVSLSNSAVAYSESGAVVGQINVVDPDAGDVHSFSLSDDRFSVVDGQLVLKPGVSIEPAEMSGLNIDVTATDSSGSSTVETLSVEILDVPEISIDSGFQAQYFDVDHSLRKLSDIDWDATPTHQEVTGDINYENSRNSFWEDGSRDTFGVQINGNVVVEEAGTFNFLLGGDDGAILIVDGRPVIDNDGLHGFRSRSGEIELEPGTHHIEVRYFENYGRAGLKLEWEGPGIEGKQLVTAPEIGDAQTIEGVALPINLSIDETSLPDNTTITMEGLPEGTLLQSDTQSIEVGEGGTADITGWETDFLTVTPPLGFLGEVQAKVSATVTTPDGNSAVTQETLSFTVEEAQIVEPSAEIVGGFHASYFDVDHSLKKMDDIDWDSTPTHEEMVSDINYENGRDSFWEGGSTDTFGARLEGEVTIEEGGSYTFFAGGDDGVVLFVNGVEVIDNDGLHGFRTRSGEIELEPGTYEIELRYFENYGHAGLKLEWDGPGTDGRELVRADSETSVDQNDTLEIGINLNGTSDQATLEISGLPPDTILISGEMSAVVGDEPVDISDWNIDLLEISPPPSFEGVIEGEINVQDTGFNGADTSSSTPFSITVGDASLDFDVDEAQADIVMADDQMMQVGGEQGWDADLSDDDILDGGDDVMAEVAVVQDVESFADLDTDTVGQPDW